MTLDAPSALLQQSRFRSITIFAVLVIASILGATVAQLTADPMPLSIGQPDALMVNEAPIDVSATSPDPLAFGD